MQLRIEIISTRKTGLYWLKSHDPSEMDYIHVSKHHPRQKLWFFTLPTSYLVKATGHKHLKLLCQHESNPKVFHYLKIPFSFIHDRRENFDKRKSGDQFDLHISSKMGNRFSEERSKNSVKFGKHVKYK